MTHYKNNLKKITLVTKNNCIQCKMSKNLLNNLEIDFVEKDIENDKELASFVKDDLGFLSVPVIITDNDNWSGFRPDKIKELQNKKEI